MEILTVIALLCQVSSSSSGPSSILYSQEKCQRELAICYKDFKPGEGRDFLTECIAKRKILGE